MTENEVSLIFFFTSTEDSEVKLSREKSDVQQRRIETLESEAVSCYDSGGWENNPSYPLVMTHIAMENHRKTIGK